MKTIIIEPKSTKELAFITEMLKRLGIKNKILTEEDREDLGLINAMEEGRKTKFVSRERIMKKLKK
jgi:hypothetical protein